MTRWQIIYKTRGLYFLGVSLPCHFWGVSLTIHNFIIFYALEDTSENLYKFRENHSKNAWK